jgi:HlyD family secretion protein
MANEIARIRPGTVPATPDGSTNRALLEFQSPTMALIARPVPPLSSRLTWVISSMFAMMLVVAGTLPIDRVVTGSGKVASKSSNLLIQPLETSIVRSIDVKLGQRVHKGDLLARLDPTFTGADLASSEALTQSLQAEVDRLQAEAAGKTYRADGTPASILQAALFAQRQAERGFKIESYRQKISSLETALRKAQDEARIYSERFGLATSLLQSREEAERLGVGSKLNTLSARDSKAESQRALQSAQSAALAARKDLDALTAERDGLLQTDQFATSQELNEARRKRDDAREQLNKARRRRELVDIRADQDATVFAIAKVSVGSVISTAEPFLTLVPDDSTMEIEGAIPAAQIGYVRVGDEVVIKLDAYRSNEHGFVIGHVRTIAPDAQDNKAEGPDRPKIDSIPVELGSTVYQVKVSIDELKLTNIPPDFRLQPGLGATLDVQVGKRTALSYLMTRMIPALTEGMREP